MTWRGGTAWNRWYGQPMKPEQTDIIITYYQQTTTYEVPAWAHGLRYVSCGEESEWDRHMQWDYGLAMDQELLCLHRRGRLPFDLMPNLWETLNDRRCRLRMDSSGNPR